MTFNLLTDPWIPVLDPGGATLEVNLVDAVTNAHQYRSLAAESPIVNISLLRVLLAVTHRVFGPESADAWADLWTDTQFDRGALLRYLDPLTERFDLFSATTPFFQCPDLNEDLAKPASVLRFVQTNNTTLFDHTSIIRPDPMSPSEAAQWLVTFQYFDVGGMKTAAKGGKEPATASPLVGVAVVTIDGGNLFETLLLNMVRVDPNNDRPFPGPSSDAPAWESNTPGIESRSRRPVGHTDWLTFQTRRIRLIPGDMGLVERAVVTPGDKLDGFELSDIEQFVPYRLTQNKQASTPWIPIRIDPARALWRNASAIVSPSGPTSRRPRLLDWIDELRELGHLSRDHLTLSAGGVANDKSQYLMWRLEHHPVPAGLLNDPDLLSVLNDAVQLADTVGRAIIWAIRPSGTKDDPTGFGTGASDRVESDYWAAAGQGFDDLLAGLGDDPIRAARDWSDHIEHAADSAIQPLLSAGDGKHLNRVVATERRLRGRTRKALAAFDETLESLS